MNHELLKYYVNHNYSFYTRSYINDEDILKRITYYAKPEQSVAGKIEFVYNDEVIGFTDITTTIPSITASSTDALRDRVKPEEKDKEIIEYVWLIIKILIILIISVLLIIILVIVHRWQVAKDTKKNIKYYPIKRDARRNKELQKEAEQNKKEDK